MTIATIADLRRPSPKDFFTVCFYGLLWPSQTITDHHQSSPTITDYRDHHLKTTLQSVFTVCYDHRDHHRPSLTITNYRDLHLKTPLRSVITICYDHRDPHLVFFTVCNYDLLWPSRPSSKVFSTGCYYGLLCSSRPSLTSLTITDHHHPSPIDHHRPSRPSPKDFSTDCFYGLLWPSRPSPSITDWSSLTIETIA